MNQEEFKKEMDVLEQKAVRAERLSRVFHGLTILSLILVISFGVSAFIFSQYIGKLMIVSMICSISLLLCLSAHFNFTQDAGNIRMKKVFEAKKQVDDLVREAVKKGLIDEADL